MGDKANKCIECLAAPRYGVRRAIFHAPAVLLVALVLAASLFGGTVPVSGAQAAAPKKIVVLGDSLTAGYRLPPGAAFPSVLERELRRSGFNVQVVNAGVSGDTASGGLARLDWALGGGADGVIVELGANDMLRGLDPAVTRRALDQIISRLKSRNIPVLLAGMVAAPGMGKQYEQRFNAIYRELARKHDVVFYPFFLDGVAGQSAFNLDDGMHPNPKGVSRIVQRIKPKVLELLKRAGVTVTSR